MKKLIVLVAATLFCIACLASVPSNSISNYGEERVNCKRIRVGVHKAHVTLINGEKKIIPLDDLESYVVNGRIYEKKELYRYGRFTSETAFMQLLKKRGGFSFYKNEELDPEKVGTDKSMDVFYVYNGDELYLRVDRKTLPNACNFFGMKWTYR